MILKIKNGKEYWQLVMKERSTLNQSQKICLKILARVQLVFVDTILRRWSKMSLYLLETRRRYDAFKGSDPMPSSLMRRATGLCAEEGEEDVLSVAHVPWGRLMLRILSPFGSVGGDGTRWNSHDETGTERGALVRIRDRSIARRSHRG